MTEIATKYTTELYFGWWLDELTAAGYIKEWEFQKNQFSLFDGAKYKVEKQLKTKVKIEEKSLLSPATYTPDFTIYWDKSAEYLFFEWLYSAVSKKPLFFSTIPGRDEHVSFVDTKPIYELHQSKTAKFVIIQKWVYDKVGVYVHSVTPEKLFAKTFTPKRYLLTDKTNKPRKIKWEVKTLKEFANER